MPDDSHRIPPVLPREEPPPVMEGDSLRLPPLPIDRVSPRSSNGRWTKLLGSLGILGTLFKFKWLLGFLKTGLSMFLSIGVYSLYFGWRFALGFVVLIFIHEMGHVFAAWQQRIPVSAPMFIPFLGAYIIPKERFRDAWSESVVGIGGPILGSLGAALCLMIHQSSPHPIWMALAHTGFFLNLFNLIPAGFLDGGRIAAAVSPRLWPVGYAILIGMLVYSYSTSRNFDEFIGRSLVILIILATGFGRLMAAFRPDAGETTPYFAIGTQRRWIMGGCYAALLIALSLAMWFTESRAKVMP